MILQNNSTSNDSAATAEESNSLFLLLAIMYTSLQVTGISGNFLVIYVIHTQRRLQTNYYFLVCHLAISDLLVLLTIIERTLYYWFPTKTLFFSSVMCKLFYLTHLLFYTSGILFLLLIRLLRYRALFYPYAKPLPRKKSKLVIIAVYIASMLISLPYAMLFKIDNGACVIPVHHKLLNIIFTVFLFYLNFYVPTVILTVLYSRIVHHLWIREKNDFDDISESNIASARKAFSSEIENRERRQRCIRASLVSFIVVVVFLVSSAPFEIMLFLDVLGQTKSIQAPWWIYCIKLLGSSVVNPLIYGIVDKSLRAGYQRFFRRMTKCCPT